MTNETSLEKKPIDYLASALKGSLAAVPLIGGVVSEFLIDLLPNQRIDRIKEYLVILSEKN